jgi:hypothetical protein
MATEEDFDLSAGMLRADSGDLGGSVDVLARKLEESLPTLTSVKRRKVGGFRSKRTVVEHVQVALGDEQFEIASAPHGFQCTRHKVVRGITLNRTELPMAEWISEMIQRVSTTAEVTEQARSALEGLLL